MKKKHLSKNKKIAIIVMKSESGKGKQRSKYESGIKAKK